MSEERDDLRSLKQVDQRLSFMGWECRDERVVDAIEACKEILHDGDDSKVTEAIAALEDVVALCELRLGRLKAFATAR